MTIVVKLTTLMIRRHRSQFFKGPNKRSEDLINIFEQFKKKSYRTQYHRKTNYPDS